MLSLSCGWGHFLCGWDSLTSLPMSLHPHILPPPNLHRHSPDHDRECPRYEVDSQGSRVGCAVGEAGTLASLITVTVNGSGGAHGVHAPVSCTDADIDMAAVGEPIARAMRGGWDGVWWEPLNTCNIDTGQVSEYGAGQAHSTPWSAECGPTARPSLPCPFPTEVLAPPVLTAECESTGARVRWAPQSRFQTAFVFTLQINQVGMEQDLGGGTGPPKVCLVADALLP